jgi:hypothetical protein
MGNKEREYKRTLKRLREIFPTIRTETASLIAAKQAEVSEEQRKKKAKVPRNDR